MDVAAKVCACVCVSTCCYIRIGIACSPRRFCCYIDLAAICFLNLFFRLDTHRNLFLAVRLVNFREQEII